MFATPTSVADPERPVRMHLGPLHLSDEAAPIPILVRGRHLILMRDGERLVAAERACPHEGADLSLGRCAAGRIHCPRHLASFDLASGAVSPGWSFRALRLYRVIRANDGL
ncbi:Rieske (2Fe-2S) protein [Methylobacterium sp. E-025]|uniref:Rieske (2Fe-2S) protein n=3 Tax=unclassified Methylobacterium TaxID=2615210 RepID=UPI0028BD438B|nr:Rieske (2Fe-2S) protein [Methylobacterium sp. E-025]